MGRAEVRREARRQAVKLPVALPNYNRESEQEMRKRLEIEDALSFKKGQDLRLQRGERLILVSPNGTLYYITVDNAGALGTTAV